MIRKIGYEHGCMFHDIIHEKKLMGENNFFGTYFPYVMLTIRLKFQHLLATTVSPSLV